MRKIKNNNKVPEYLLYVTINMINGKVYGGKHYKVSNKVYKGSGTHLKKAFKKYGKENFTVRYFKLKITTPENLNRLEIKLIRRLVRKFGKNCYNIHRGGRGGYYLEYAGDEKYKEFKKSVSEGLFDMYKDPEKYNNWYESLSKRKDTIRKRIETNNKTDKELRKVKFIKDHGRSKVTYRLVYPNGTETIESNCLKNFVEKYHTDDFIFRRIRNNGSYIFKRVTKLSKHPFPKNTVIHYVSEYRTFDDYNK